MKLQHATCWQTPAPNTLSFILILVFSASALVISAAAQTAHHPPSANSQNGVSIEMSNVLFRYSPDLTVNIVRLRGTLLPTQGHSVPSFNDASSFLVAADSAEMRMTMAQLAALMNSWLLRSPKAQLKNIHITAQGDQLLIHGTMKKGLHVPFSSTGAVSVSSDNRIRIAVEKITTAKLPVKGLLDALGLSLDDLISQKGMQGISVDKDSFLIDPQTAFPPPQIRAKISAVKVAGQSLLLTFGEGLPKLHQRPWKNYIAMRGGAMEYGREEMFDSDLTMIDSTPADPFEFYLNHYWCQMVAGAIKAQPDKSMRVFVPDYSKLPKGACEQ